MDPRTAVEAAGIIRAGHARGDAVTYDGEPVAPGTLPARVAEALPVEDRSPAQRMAAPSSRGPHSVALPGVRVEFYVEADAQADTAALVRRISTVLVDAWRRGAL